MPALTFDDIADAPAKSGVLTFDDIPDSPDDHEKQAQLVDVSQKMALLQQGSVANPVNLALAGEAYRSNHDPAADLALVSGLGGHVFYEVNKVLDYPGLPKLTYPDPRQILPTVSFKDTSPYTSVPGDTTIQGIAAGTANLIRSLSTGKNIAIAAALPEAHPLIKKGAEMFFAGTMGKNAVEKGIEAYGAQGGERAQLATEALGSGVLAGLAGTAAFGRPSVEVGRIQKVDPLQAKSIEALTGANPNGVASTVAPTENNEDAFRRPDDWEDQYKPRGPEYEIAIDKVRKQLGVTKGAAAMILDSDAHDIPSTIDTVLRHEMGGKQPAESPEHIAAYAEAVKQASDFAKEVKSSLPDSKSPAVAASDPVSGTLAPAEAQKSITAISPKGEPVELKPTQEGPHVVSTAIEMPDGKLAVGNEPFSPHQQGKESSIGGSHAAENGSTDALEAPQKDTGFVVQDADGAMRFTKDRVEAGRIADAADQRTEETKGEPLQSQDLKRSEPAVDPKIEQKIEQAKQNRPGDPAGFLREMANIASQSGFSDVETSFNQAADTFEGAPAKSASLKVTENNLPKTYSDPLHPDSIRAAHAEIVKETGFPAVRISALAKELGLKDSQAPQLANRLLDMRQRGEADLPSGDHSLVSEPAKKWSVEAPGNDFKSTMVELRPAILKEPIQALHDFKAVDVKAPAGTTFLRVTDSKGRAAIEPLGNVAKGANPFHQAGPFRSIEAGTKGAKGQFNPIKGDVGITERVPSVTKGAVKRSPKALGITPQIPGAGIINGIGDYVTGAMNHAKAFVKGAAGQMFPRTTMLDRVSGELAARWVSSRTAAPFKAASFTGHVLEGLGVDPNKLGAALTEDNLRSVKEGFNKSGDPAKAAGVVSIIGAKGSPFRTEAEYHNYLKEPATQQAIARHIALWESTVDPLHRQAMLMDPTEPLSSRGLQTGARINLFNDPKSKGANVVTGTGTGNLNATMRKRSPFGRQATGTGQQYNINYADQMANTFGRQLEIANKNSFEKRLIETGNAVIDKPGEHPMTSDGEDMKAFPLTRTVLIDKGTGNKIPVAQNIYIRKSLAPEYRRAADVDLIHVPAIIKAGSAALNKLALAGLTDGSVHVLNILTALATRPGAIGHPVLDTLASTFGRSDVPIILGKTLVKAFGNHADQLTELAEMGVLRAPDKGANFMGRFIQKFDQTARLVLDDAYKGMAKSGLLDDTETNRREFVNQIGQYNKRAQGDLRRLARDTGLGPFATAGTTFNTLGIRNAMMSPGVKAGSNLAAIGLRANVMAKWVGGFALVGALNYLNTGKVAGRPGVPIGNIDSGKTDKNGRPLSYPAFELLGLGRAMRVTGARGYIEAKRKGLTEGDSASGATRDILNTGISPFMGPIVRFGTVAATGYQPAINIPRTAPVVPPGKNQFVGNVKQAMIDANPIVKSIALSNEPGKGPMEALQNQLPRMSLKPSQPPEMIENYPEIVHKAQAREYTDDTIRRARQLAPDIRYRFIDDQLSKLTDDDRAHAVLQFKFHRLDYNGEYRALKVPKKK